MILRCLQYDPTVWPITYPTFGPLSAEADDWLHDPASFAGASADDLPGTEKGKGRRRGHDDDEGTGIIFTKRGMLNIGFLTLLVTALLMLFAGYPIMSHAQRKLADTGGAFNIGGTNGTEQVPDTIGRFGLIGRDTPTDAYTRTGFTGVNAGVTYDLVWSGEFETEGRTFYPGDDPYWEAVDLHYWATNSACVITMVKNDC